MDNGEQSSRHLQDVFSIADNEVYAAGWEGTVLQYNGTQWAVMESCIQTNLEGLWGLPGEKMYSVGGAGTVLLKKNTSGSVNSAIISAVMLLLLSE